MWRYLASGRSRVRDQSRTGGWALPVPCSGIAGSGCTRLRALALSILLACSGMAAAQEIPWRSAVNFDLRAEDEPLGQFLARMFALYGLPTVTSPGMAEARISGRFRGRAETVFRGISETYGLVAYYDGSRVHLSTLAEMTSKLFYIDRADLTAVQNTLRELRLADNRFPMRVSSVDGHVLLSGPPRYVEIVTNIVNQVVSQRASDESVLDLRVFRLRHARAADSSYSIGGSRVTVPGVARLLGELLAGAPIGAIGGDYRTEPATLPGLRGSGLAATGRADEPAAPEEPGAAPPGRRPRAGANGPATGPEAAGAAARGPAGGAELGDASRPRPSSPFASVRAEPRINAVIVRDRRERMPIYARLIQALDVDTPLVEIEASVIDINSEKAESLGVDWRAHTRRVDVASSPNGLSTTGLRPVEPLLSGGPGLVGTVLLGNERSYFLSRVNALADRGDARLLARPRVLTTDNSEAVLSSTRDFYVRVAGRDEVDLFNVSLGLKLRVTPALVEDPEGRRFRLIVQIEDGSSDGSAVDQIPVVSRNAISTQAVIGDGQSLLIGGYTIETRRNDQIGLPGVGTVPVLGWLFGQRSQTNTRVERMFLITPRLVQRAAPPGRAEEPTSGGAAPSAPPAGAATPAGR